MKVFLSHPMHGIPEDEVLLLREDAIAFLIYKFGDVDVIDNYHHKDAPENAGRLWHLGRSIQQIGEADAVYFCGDYKSANGCLVEHIICRLYDVPVLNDKLEGIRGYNMANIEVNWSGSYPCLCMGEWSLCIDGNDATHLIPENLRSSEMNACHTDSYEDWRKEYPESSNWVTAFPYQFRREIYNKIKEKDFIKHTCGGCQ